MAALSFGALIFGLYYVGNSPSAVNGTKSLAFAHRRLALGPAQPRSCASAGTRGLVAMKESKARTERAARDGEQGSFPKCSSPCSSVSSVVKELVEIFYGCWLRIRTTSESVCPRTIASCLPSNDQWKSLISSEVNDVSRFPGEPSSGCRHRLSTPFSR